jgi:hypothetical protein
MSTVLEIVTNALREAGMLGLSESADAGEAAFGLTQLNYMATAWDAQGIHTGWSDVTLSEDFPLEDRHREGVTYLLAAKIAASKGTALPPEAQAAAHRGWNLLAADYKNLETLRVDDGLQALPSQRITAGSGFNFTTG